MDYESYKALDDAGRKAAWANMSPEGRAAIKQEVARRRAASAEAPAASDDKKPGGWNSLWDNPIMNYEVMGADNPILTRGNALGTGLEQGLTLNFGDEIGGYLRDAIGQDGDAYTAQKRATIERDKAAHPGFYGTGEVAGAVAPAFVPGVGIVGGGIRGGQAVSTAAKIVQPALRGAAFGGLDAGVSQIGRNTNENRLEGVPGAVGVGALAGSILGPAGEWVSKKFGRTMTSAVERNLKEIAAETGLPAAEVARRVAAGEPLAGMTQSTRIVARAIADERPEVGQRMVAQAKTNMGAGIDNAVAAVQTNLAGRSGPLRESVERGLKDTADLTGLRLGQARAAAGGPAPADLAAAVTVAGDRAPDIATKVNRALRADGVPPLFVVDGADGAVTMARMPSVAEAEILQRIMADQSSAKAVAQGFEDKTRAASLNLLQKDLRAGVDAAAPNLRSVRDASANALEASNEGYPLGQLASSQHPDPFGMAYRGLGPDAQRAAREGGAVAVGEAKRGPSLIDSMLDDTKPLAGNLNTMTGGLAPGTTDALQRAQRDAYLMKELTGGSPTSQRLAARERLTGSSRAQSVGDDLVDAAEGGAAKMLARGLRVILGSSNSLSPTEIDKLGELIMQQGSGLAERILRGDPNAISVAVRMADKMGRAGRMAGGAVPSLLDIMGAQ